MGEHTECISCQVPKKLSFTSLHPASLSSITLPFKLHCTLSRSSLPSHPLILHSWLLVFPLGPLSSVSSLLSHNLSSTGPVQSAGHVQCTVSSPCSGLFQMPLALLSLIATIKSFFSSVPRSHHVSFHSQGRCGKHVFSRQSSKQMTPPRSSL